MKDAPSLIRHRPLLLLSIVALLGVWVLTGVADEPQAPGNEAAAPDEGESLLPAEKEGEGESLLPPDEGETLLPPVIESGKPDLFPEGEIKPPPASGEGTDPGTRETTTAAAHTTYLRWLEEEKRFPTAITCANCHPDHFEEWSVSAHAYSQMSPVFNTMQAFILKLTSGTNGDFCIRCHTQIGMQREEPLYISNLKRHPASIEGITCVVCHRVNRNYGKVSGRTAIVEGNLLREVYGPTGNAVLKAALKDVDRYKIQSDDIDGRRPVHAEALKFDPISSSGFCGTCHDVNLLNGFRLEEAFSQFKNTASNRRGETCQDCHMGVIPGLAKSREERFASARKGGKNAHLSLPELRKTGERDMNYGWGPAARVGEERVPTPAKKRTNHRFVGPDYAIIHPALFPHSKELKDFTYQGRISRTLLEAQKKAEKEKKEFDRAKSEAEGVALAKKYALADWLSFRWEKGWGTEAFEEKEKERAKADREGSSGRQSVFANLPEKEKATLIAAGWHDPDPGKWRKGMRARREARFLLDRQFELLNGINTERHQIWRRALQLGDFEVTKNDSRGLHFRVQVVNATDGHGVPTGFDAERLVFLQITVRDRDGKTVFKSGDRDPNGDIRDLHSSWVHAGKLPIDRYLFNLQSKFLTRNVRGGEQEQVLAVNQSPDPLPYIRPDTRAGILVGRPGGARKQARILPPEGSRWAAYKVQGKELGGGGPWEVNLRFIAQMVPVNLIRDIGGVGFDYNLSPREVARRVVYGHQVSPSTRDEDRRGGALTIWERIVVIDGKWTTKNLRPTEKEIMAIPPPPFPVQPKTRSGGSEEAREKETGDDEKPGESLLPGDDLLPLPEKGEDLLPAEKQDHGGENLIPGENADEGEDLIPEDDMDGEQNLLPKAN